MRAEIFPGLGQPKSQLFFDLQSFIAENGGRLRLAELLDIESMKNDWRRGRILTQGRKVFHYTPFEDTLILKKLYDELTNRSRRSIYTRRHRLHKLGLI